MKLNTGAIAIIDANVENAQQLLNGIVPGVESFLLEGDSDGILQIAQILENRPETDTLHIISHGTPGCLYLGNARLSLETLKCYQAQLQQWKIDTLLLYGCSVAAGDAGEEFIAQLHQLTGAEIAASKSLTGAAVKGGNWELEMKPGEVEWALAFTPEAMGGYEGTFAPEPFLVKDINSGSGGSNPSYLTDINGTLYFQASDPTNGTELWKSDGTAAGTVLVKDIYSGSDGSNPYNLTDFNGTLYFVASDGTNGTELWSLGTPNAAPIITSANTASVPENTTAVTTVTATDDDGDAIAYLITGGEDQSLFSIDVTTGDVTFNNAPDFENPGDATPSDNIYILEVTANDGTEDSIPQTLTITVTDVNEALPIVGTPGNDILRGTASAEVIQGLAGDDRLYGYGGEDSIEGGDGNDIIYGGDGDDLLDGGLGSDRLYGDAGNDTLKGGEGNDILYGKDGGDILEGGLGSDRLYGDTGADTFVLESGLNSDNIYYFEDGSDRIQLVGLTFADVKITAVSSSTLIEVAATGEDLALLSGVNAGSITADDFVGDAPAL